MNARRTLVALIPLLLLAARATPGDPPGPKIEVTMGVLVQDTTCAHASYALVDVCGFLHGDRTPQLYVAFPRGKNVDRFLEHNVRMSGTMEFTSCGAPLLRATDIGDSSAPPPLCPRLCNPGDPPPCPQ